MSQHVSWLCCVFEVNFLRASRVSLTHLNLRFPNSFRISGIKHDTDNTLHSSLEKLGEKLAQNFRF